MEKSLSDQVLDKVSEIVEYIKNSSSYQKFMIIEDKMQQDDEIMTKIAEVKDLQKEMVKLESLKKDISSLEMKRKTLLEELQNYPIYQEYIYLLEDLNNIFQEIKTVLEKYINDKIN